MTENTTYKSIFKSTTLFASVQVINIISKVILNKIIAILLGTAGVGMLSIYNTMLQTIKTIAGLGISQSAVRDISVAHADETTLAVIKKMTNHWGFLCSVFGMIGTIFLSSILSRLAFNSDDFTFPIILFSIAVFFTIWAEVKQAVIKGVRNLRDLAMSTVIGTLFGVALSIPMYYLLGMRGIVPSLITMAAVVFICTLYYERKVIVPRCNSTIKESIVNGKKMAKMGISLMYLSLTTLIVDFTVKAFIIRLDGIEQVGIFQAGSTIILSYFGIIMSALTTDYYPRISAIFNDNQKLNFEMNRQVEVSLLLIAPMIVFVISFANFLISLLYTNAFEAAVPYTCLAAIAMLLNIPANTIGMILIAKQESKIFVIYATLLSVIFLVTSLTGYYLGSLIGLGIAAIINGLINFFVINTIINEKYKIKYSKSSLMFLSTMGLLSGLCTVVNLSEISQGYKYIVNSLIFVVVVFLAIKYLMKLTEQTSISEAIRKIFQK